MEAIGATVAAAWESRVCEGRTLAGRLGTGLYGRSYQNPVDKWPDELPQPQVWVESQKDWHEICAGAAERGIFTFLKEQDVFHFQGKPLFNGLFGVEKKNKSLDSGEPVLRMITNAIPANALQQTIEADIPNIAIFWTMVSHFG